MEQRGRDAIERAAGTAVPVARALPGRDDDVKRLTHCLLQREAEDPHSAPVAEADDSIRVTNSAGYPIALTCPPPAAASSAHLRPL